MLQAILKFRHEIKVEHVFVIGNVGKKFEITLVSISWLEYLLSLLNRAILHSLYLSGYINREIN